MAFLGSIVLVSSSFIMFITNLQLTYLNVPGGRGVLYAAVPFQGPALKKNNDIVLCLYECILVILPDTSCIIVTTNHRITWQTKAFKAPCLAESRIIII